jgi:GT2 family glycosyltransferase
LVVAYGGHAELDRSLAALGDGSVIVVDNSSSPQVRAVATRHDAWYIDAGSNLGFAAGVNLGLRQMERNPPENVLLLNPDAIIRPDDLAALVDHLGAAHSERVAAVAPRLFELTGAPQRVVWPFPSPWRAWVEAVGLGRFPRGRTFVIGAVLLLRWSAICEVGMFDERFFLYAEETDWQRRAVNRGWRSEVCANAVAEHRGAGSSDDELRRETLFHAGQETYIRKWYGTFGWWLYRAAAGSGAGVRALLLRGARRSAARRRALLYLRGPRRSAGLVSN